MAITDKEQGVWNLDQVYNKINEGGIWSYNGPPDQFFVWGYNEVGQLAQNDTTPGRSSPIQISGTDWSRMGSGAYAVGGIKTDGTAWTWGANTYGVLGHNNEVHYSSPTQLPGTWDYLQSGSTYGLTGYQIDQA